MQGNVWFILRAEEWLKISRNSSHRRRLVFEGLDKRGLNRINNSFISNLIINTSH